MSINLSDKHCVPCEGGVDPMTKERASEYGAVVPKWRVSDDAKTLARQFTFPDFKGALSFVNQIGTIAESEGHHPDITLGWGKVGVTLTTHAIKGLSENDFIMAFKIDQI